MKLLNVLGVTSLLLGCGGPSSPDSQTLVWEVTNQKWDATADKEFSAWVEKLGTARAAGLCIKLADCLRSTKANTLFDSRDSRLSVFADCADLPMVLRAYFAYKTKRPFSMAKVSGSQYSAGNKVKCEAKGSGLVCQELNQTSYSTLPKLLTAVVNTIQSGYYRTSADSDGTDTFPIDINRSFVKPGTVFYDPNGHVLVVYKVETNGLIRMIDSHPDNSLTTALFGDKFARGAASQGGGFRNWRPYQLVGTQVVRAKNSEIVNLGFNPKAQYKPNKDYPAGNYHKWVREQLSQGLKIQPVSEFGEKLNQLCVDFQDRVVSVQKAIDTKIHLKPHPSQLPSNIYGTDGEWESYSTPSRDARLKASVRELNQFLKDSLSKVDLPNHPYDWSGNSQELLEQYQLSWKKAINTPTCQLSYVNSQGTSTPLSLKEAVGRLYDLSFDPYHCIELRWGVKPGDSGFNTSACQVGDKVDWYVKESRLRNAIDREYGKPTPLDWGPATQEPIDFTERLSSR